MAFSRTGGLTRPLLPRRPILRARRLEPRPSALGVFPKLVLWWFRAKRNSGSATQAIEFLRCILGAWRFSPAAVAGIIMPTKPTIIELDMDKLESVLRRAETNELTEDDCETIRTLFASYVHLLDLLKNKKTSIDRLRKLLFGARTEKLAAVLGERKDLPPQSADASAPAASTVGGGADAGVQPQSAVEPEEAAEKTGKGHGRNGADAYTAAEKIDVPHESLQPGDPCPKCGEGTVYQSQRPGVLEESADDSAESSKAERTGLFTTGIVSTRAGQKIALFLSGRQHAGENLKDVLVRRTRELPPPIQMCDALSRNLPGELATIVAHCLAHGRRQFVGDVFMGLIYTCELCGANPFDYLTELKRHAGELSANPQDWMPWNYRKTLNSKGT